MKSTRAILLSLALLSAVSLAPSGVAQVRRGRSVGARVQSVAESPREESYRANNLGVAMLEQFKHREGAEEFRRALRLDPQNTLARINLAVALYNVPDIAEAERAARDAIESSPRAPQPHYILGLIYKQQNRSDDAASEFERVLEVDSDDTGANVQLGQVYLQQRKFPEAAALFRRAVAAEPYNGTALYNLATTLIRAGERSEGQQLMQRFQSLRASGAATVIGQNYLEQGRYAEAITSTGAEADLVDRATPDVSFKDVTASALPASSSDYWRGAWPVKDSFLEQSGGAVVLFDFDGDGQLDLLEVAGGRARLYHNDRGKFTDVTAQSGALAKEADGVATAAIAGDYDNDGKPDLFILRYGASTLYHNDGDGHFTDATAAAKIPNYPYLSKSAAFVDYDHDGDLDIFIAGSYNPADLIESHKREEKSKGAEDITDVPLVFGSKSPSPNLLLRNNGDGTFTDVTVAAKLSDSGAAFAVVPTDYDNRRDVDLLVTSIVGPVLWRNMRDGTFRNVTADVGLKNNELLPTSCVAAADVNKDGFTDFFFGLGSRGTFGIGPAGFFALSDGRGHFRFEHSPAVRASNTISPTGVSIDASQFLDYDNDGLLDLVTVVSGSSTGLGVPHLELRIWRNVGDGWVDVSDKAAHGIRAEIGAIGTSLSRSRVLASGDLDGDGDTDIIFGVPGGGLRVLRNEGGNRNNSVRVRLAGKVSNRGGVEAKVDVRAGSLQQRLETFSAFPSPAPTDLTFGIGRRAYADAVRVIWPSGVVQSETESATREGTQTIARVEPGTLKVTELDRKPSSCPYLYTWNGERFEFITDFMGGGEMGDWESPGVFDTPDPDEYVRIRGDQLKARDGRYEIRVTNELEEALFVDRLQLVAVSHPSDTEVYPNEGLGNPTGPDFKLYATRGAHTPRSAFDEHGHDVLARIAKLDRKYVDDFALLPIRGYAAEHTLTLDLGRDERRDGETGRRGDGETKLLGARSSFTSSSRQLISPSPSRPISPSNPSSRTLLLLTGWTDYAFSSDNVAASQQGLEMKLPSLQVKDKEGKWQTVIENIGFPVGRPQTVTVDLTGKFLSASREVRIVTSMRIYWDQILVDDSGGDAAFRLERLEATDATLRPRGFSAQVSADGREPFGYDYARVSTVSPWKYFTGHYTRFGDVRELLRATDDMFVVSEPGDEIALSFDATELKPLPAGWTRTFLLYADGFSKEMDINSASPHELAPLPFHRMKRYPYSPPETYPDDEAHRAYVERYNTRVVNASLPALAAGN